MEGAHHRLRITRIWDGRRFRPAVYDTVAHDAAGGSRHLGPRLCDPAVVFHAATEEECDRYIDGVRDGRPYVPSVATPADEVALHVEADGQTSWLAEAAS